MAENIGAVQDEFSESELALMRAMEAARSTGTPGVVDATGGFMTILLDRPTLPVRSRAE